MSIFAEEEKLYRSSLAFKSMLDAEDRSFNEKLSEMDIALAQELAAAETEGLQTAAMYSGLAETAKGGIQAYSSYTSGGFDTEYQDYKSRKGNDALSYSEYKKGIGRGRLGG
jgi:hypothetical protein